MKEGESHILLQKEKDWQSFKGIFFVPGINTFADDCTTFYILHNSCTQYSHGPDIPGGRRVFFLFFLFFYQNVTAMIDMHPVRMYTFPLGIRGKVQRKGFNSVVLALNKVTQCLLVYNLQ